MVYVDSQTPDITESLPAIIAGGGGSVVQADATSWDVSIGGLGFLLRPSAQNPYQRGTEQVRKQQIDTSTSAGEQSLSSWWQRSQDSWHMGAGVKWYDPGAERATVNRFENSQGVDPWRVGYLSLLHKMEPVGSVEADTLYVSGLSVGGVRGYVKAHGSSIAWVPSTGSGTSGTLPASGATQPTATGGVVWVGHNGGVSKFDAATGTVTTPWTSATQAQAWWVKARLIVAIGPSLYELTPSGSGVITSLTPLYTHPQSTWRWSDVAETGASILASGFADNDSAVFEFMLQQDSSNVYILSGGAQVAKMPPGEHITCMGTYLAGYIVLGTSSGVRVGLIGSDSSITYGPVTVELENDAVDVTFYDRFAYVAVTSALPDGTTGVVRIDLSNQVTDSNGDGTGFFAWAWDVSTTVTSPGTSLCLVGDRVVMSAGNRIYEQSPTDYVDSGWLTTGGVRFRTVEPKVFRLARMMTSLNGGSVALSAILPNEAEYRVVEFTPVYSSTSDVSIAVPGATTTYQWMNFRVTLKPSLDGQSPTLSGVVIKAAPAPSRIRLFSFPLQAFDYEVDRNGNRYGRDGWAYDRVRALEAVEESGGLIRIVDNRTGESFVGQIDTVDFSSTAPPDRSASGWGGLATVVVRRL